jgi:tetratricopeptide (TPR) repeat protein
MKNRRLISKQAAGRLLESALRHWNQREYGKYLDIMLKAARFDPANSAIQIDLGAAYGFLCEFSAAEQCFERGVALAPGKAEALAMAGLKCRNFNRYDMAERYLARAVEQKGVTSDMLAKLAEMQERMRNLDSAGEMVERALRLDPRSPLAMLVSARLARASNHVEQAEKTVRSFLSRSDSNSWSTRIRGWYELGHILDQQARYDEAMAAFLQAKKMILPHAGALFSAEASVHRQYAEASAALSTEMIDRWRANATEFAKHPQRFATICGHPRSGTTLLEQLLDSHSEVVSAEETMIFFESYLDIRRAVSNESNMAQAMDDAPSSALLKAREHYFSNIRKFVGAPVADRLLIDKNPSLTGLALALLRLIPETKFVIAVRDPRDVCLSCFMQPLPLNQVSSHFLTLENTASEYAALMGFWQAVASHLPGDSQYLEVRYEDLVKDVESVTRRVVAFLGLDWEPEILRFHERARQKLIRSPTYTEVARPITSGAVGRWKNYAKYMAPSIETLDPFIRAYGYKP